MKYLSYILVTVFVAGVFATPIAQADHVVEHTTAGATLLDNVLNDLLNSTTTTTSLAVGFSRDGVYGCTGGSYGSVGMQGPGGAHVPTFDDAQHDQIRLLTYKECLLDGIVNSMRETLISFIIKSVVRWTNQGFDGNPAYVTNIPLHMLERISDPEAERIITGSETDALSSIFRRDVRVMLAKEYSNKTRSPEKTLGCELEDTKLQSFLDGDFYGGGGWDSFFTLSSNQSCNPIFAYKSSEKRLNEALMAEQERERTQLDWGSGFRTVERDRTIDLGDGQSTNLKRIVTPGFMLSEHLRQTIGTGLRQSENADEIDEIISALMANIGTKMLTDIEGLSGLSSSFSGQPSYIDRIASDSAARTRGNMVGAAAAVVNKTLRVERDYTDARKGSANELIRARTQLETWESTCWSGVITQAKADLKARVEDRACPEDDAGERSCSVTATVTETRGLGSIGILVPSTDNISVYGRATRGDSTMSVTALGSGITVGPVRPTVITTGNWDTGTMIMSSVPDGNITVTASETLADGGSISPIVAEMTKVTTITGVELSPPTSLPDITITVTANATTETVTFSPSTARSRAITNQSITTILDLIRDNIFKAEKALQVLAQIKNALASTVSASGQRFILERLDQLVAARILHTDGHLRQANDQAIEISAAMQQLLDETRESWEAGWCDPSNWEQVTN